MLILGLLGMYFDAAVVFVTNSSLFFQIDCGHTVRLQPSRQLLLTLHRGPFSSQIVSLTSMFIVSQGLLYICTEHTKVLGLVNNLSTAIKLPTVYTLPTA